MKKHQNSPEKDDENGSFFGRGKPVPNVVFSMAGRRIPSLGNDSVESDSGNLRSPDEAGVKVGTSG
jgi:hypothetical protein